MGKPGDPNIERLRGLLAITAREWGEAVLLIANPRETAESTFRLPYGVLESQSDAWERANFLYRIEPPARVPDGG